MPWKLLDKKYKKIDKKNKLFKNTHVIKNQYLINGESNQILKLEWSHQLSISKVNKCMFILYRAKQFNFKRETLFTLYTWFVRTSLEYAAPVWHSGLTIQQRDRLERVQKRCFRVILGESYVKYSNALAHYMKEENN